METQKILNADEYPDKITWGKADCRKELRFNSSNLEEAKERLKNYLEIIKDIDEGVQGGTGKLV